MALIPLIKRCYYICIFLLENTQYSSGSGLTGFWLENPSQADSYKALGVASSSRIIGYTDVNRTIYFGVRPVIEVLKTDIDF